eukprot:89679_1
MAQQITDDTKIIGLDDNDDQANEKIKNKLMNSNEPITLNVGGIKFETTLSTLTKYENSVLAKMFQGNFSLKPSKDGSYFIDRNGTFFEYILDFLRTGQINIPDINKEYIIKGLLIETDFYQLTSLQLLLKNESNDEQKDNHNASNNGMNLQASKTRIKTFGPYSTMGHCNNWLKKCSTNIKIQNILINENRDHSPLYSIIYTVDDE